MKKTSTGKLRLRKNVVAQLGKNDLHQLGGGGSEATCDTLADTMFRTINSAKGCTGDPPHTNLPYCQTRITICLP